MQHIPVLLNETMEALNPRIGEFFIDGTIGNAGHGLDILKRIGPKGKLLGIDWDKNAIEKLKIGKLSALGGSVKGGKDYKNVILINDNYANLLEILKERKLPKADGLILDLGFSSEQLKSGKGFSFQKDELLDMRYSGGGITAMEAVNTFSEKDLADIIYEYGEERYSRKIAKNIIKQRKRKPIKTTFDLVEVIRKSVPMNYERKRIHPATRTFQALRIYVNDELGNLERLLKNLDQIIKNKGRAVIISFHSLEDRLVKNHFRELKKAHKAEILTKKPVRASAEEVGINPRARSAKLRAIQL